MSRLTVEELTKALEAYRVKNNLTKSALAQLMSVPAPSLKGWIADPNMASYSRPSTESTMIIEDFLRSVDLLPNGESQFTNRSTEEGINPAPVLSKKIEYKRDTPERISRLRHLLSLIAVDLEALKSAGESDRELYRTMLDPRDLGYLSSLMAMLSDEGQFQRWLHFNTYRFQQFKGGRDQ